MRSTRKNLASLASAALLMLLATASQATVYYVSVNTGLDANPGTVALPFKTIQKAINFVPVYSVVLVAAGTYHESLSWTTKQLHISGAGVGLSIIDPSVTNGGPGGRCLHTTSLGSNFSYIDGFTFQNGSAADFGGGVYNSSSSLTIQNCAFSNNNAKQGAGMYNATSTPTISHCIFSMNNSINSDAGAYLGGGGGMFNADSSPILTDCTFSNNNASGLNNAAGGGMVNMKLNPNLTGSHPSLTGCTFNNNYAYAGGGAMFNRSGSPAMANCTVNHNQTYGIGGGIFNIDSSPTVTICVLGGNTANSGGGMCSFGNSSPILTNCSFDFNRASTGNGGGMVSSSYGATSPILPLVTNCIFDFNEASGNGGGVYTQGSRATVTNCLIVGNDAMNGGGVYSENGGITVNNCTIAQNAAIGAHGVGGGMFSQNISTVINCIVWGNTWGNSGKPGDVPMNGGLYGPGGYTYSDVQGLTAKTPDSRGNFGAIPLFVDAVNNNFRLMTGSPCIARGNTAIVKSPPFLAVNGTCIDLDGFSRTSVTLTSRFRVVGQGAYEKQ